MKLSKWPYIQGFDQDNDNNPQVWNWISVMDWEAWVLYPESIISEIWESLAMAISKTDSESFFQRNKEGGIWDEMNPGKKTD